MIRCAIYPRKSKADDNSESMETQISMCKEYIQQNYKDYFICVYDGDFGITGHSTKKRKDFQRMMNDIKSGLIDIVVVQRYDRIARNTRDFCNLYYDMEKSNCNLVSVSQKIDTTTPYGKKFMYDLASTAELEWALCSERHRDVNRYARLNGKLNISPKCIPFGYKAEIVDGVRRMLKDTETSHIVEDALNYYLLHQSKMATTKYINEKYNLHKSHSFIDTLLNSEFYRGKYRENDNFCEPYITEEQNKIIQSRKNSYIRTHYDSRRIYLFTGLLKCPLCNRTLEPKGELLKSGSTYHYYRCTEPYRTKNCTFKYNINERYIEDFLLTYLDDYLKNYKAQVEILNNTKNKKSDIKKYIDEKQRLTTAFIKGRLPEDVYDSEFERLEKLIAQESIDESKEIDIDRLSKILSDDWKIVYLQLKRENQKLFWKSIIKSIQFNDDKTVKSVIFL